MASLHTWHSQGPRDPGRHTTSMPDPHWADRSPLGQPQEQTPVDDPHGEEGIKPRLSSKGGLPKEEDQNLSTSCTSYRLNPHDQLGRLCVYGIYKRTMTVPTKENALALVAVDSGGKHMQE